MALKVGCFGSMQRSGILQDDGGWSLSARMGAGFCCFGALFTGVGLCELRRLVIAEEVYTLLLYI